MAEKAAAVDAPEPFSAVSEADCNEHDGQIIFTRNGNDRVIYAQVESEPPHTFPQRLYPAVSSNLAHWIKRLVQQTPPAANFKL
jgi:hypothetical protein